MGNKLKYIIPLLIIVLTATVFFYMKKDTPATNDNIENIKVGYGTDYYSGQLLFDIAKEQNIFKRNNLQVAETRATKQTNTLLNAGKVDVVLTNTISGLSDYLNDFDTIWIASIYKNLPDISLVTKTKDTSKTIRFGLSRLGGQSQVTADAVLQNMGWSKDKIKYVISGDIKTRWSYMQKGQIDATFAYPGEGFDKMVASQGLNVYGQEQIYRNEEFSTGLFTTKKIASKKSIALKRFVKAIGEARAFMITHKTDTLKSLKSKFKLTEQSAEDLYVNIIKVSGQEITPKKSSLVGTMKSSIIEVDKPKNPNRDLSEFVSTDFIQEVMPSWPNL